MELTIKIPRDRVQMLKSKAASHGLSVQDWLLELAEADDSVGSLPVGEAPCATRPGTGEGSDFEKQRRLFRSICRSRLVPYRGRYVVCRDGQIMDSDFDLPALTSRFFGQYGHVPVYITKVGAEAPALIATPFFE